MGEFRGGESPPPPDGGLGVSPRINKRSWAGGWESLPAAGGNSVHVTAMTPTSPIAHNAPNGTLQRNADPEARLTRGVGILPAAPAL